MIITVAVVVVVAGLGAAVAVVVPLAALIASPIVCQASDEPRVYVIAREL